MTVRIVAGVRAVKATHDRAGRPGVHIANVHSSRGWHAHLAFSTHGMTGDQAQAEHARLVARHERKAARLEDLQTLVGAQLVGGFVVTDATVRDVGKRGCEFLCRARSGRERIEVRRHFDDPVEVPAAAEVLLSLDHEARMYVQRGVDAEAHAAEIRAALGIE